MLKDYVMRIEDETETRDYKKEDWNMNWEELITNKEPISYYIIKGISKAGEIVEEGIWTC